MEVNAGCDGGCHLPIHPWCNGQEHQEDLLPTGPPKLPKVGVRIRSQCPWWTNLDDFPLRHDHNPVKVHDHVQSVANGHDGIALKLDPDDVLHKLLRILVDTGAELVEEQNTAFDVTRPKHAPRPQSSSQHCPCQRKELFLTLTQRARAHARLQPASFLDERPQIDGLEDRLTIPKTSEAERVEIGLEGRPVGEEHCLLWDRDDTPAKSGPIHEVEGRMVDEGLGSGFCHWVHKLQEKSNQAGLAASRASADRYLFPRHNGEFQATESELRLLAVCRFGACTMVSGLDAYWELWG